MSTKQKEIKVCDACGKELTDGDWVTTSDSQYEGCSKISYKRESFYVGNSDYCNLACLARAIEKELGAK